MGRVLVVDDNSTFAYLTARNLAGDIEGLQVKTVNSCREANLEVELFHPSIVIVDINLADGNGLELVDDLKKKFQELVVILISGEHTEDKRAKSAFGFLLKPYEPRLLSDMVKKAMEAGLPRLHYEPVSLVQCAGYDRHHVQNKLAGLLAGLRAFGADLRAENNDPAAVLATVDEYLDRLCAVVVEVSGKLPVCRNKSRNSQ